MQRVGALGVLLTAALLMIDYPTAAAADGNEGGNVLDRHGTVQAADGSLRIHARIRRIGTPSRTGSRKQVIPATQQEPARDLAIGAQFCAGANVAEAGNGAPAIEALCGLLPVPGAVAAIPGRAEVLGAFRELGLYRGAVRSDPGRASFVNLETYFWCGDGAQTCNVLGEGERTVTLLGQAVRIRPRIVSYEWRFGDGSSGRVTAGRVAHTYGHTGAMAVSVTLTWTADFAVGGGGFRPIGGTTTTTSPVRLLPVQEAQTINDL